MKPHTKIYLLAVYGTLQPEAVICEVCDRRFKQTLDVHHIIARGMGGSKNDIYNCIENLMGACRDCHTSCENGVWNLEEQQQLHKGFLGFHSVKHDEAKIFWQRQDYLNEYHRTN